MRATNGKCGAVSKSGPKKLEDLEAEGKLAMDRLEDIANYMGDYRDIVDEYTVRHVVSPPPMSRGSVHVDKFYRRVPRARISHSA